MLEIYSLRESMYRWVPQSQAIRVTPGVVSAGSSWLLYHDLCLWFAALRNPLTFTIAFTMGDADWKHFGNWT